MSKEYILDTSAVRALSGALVEKVSNQQRLTISPLSIYEILSHLDENSKRHGAESFAFRKSHVMKCKHLVLRNDPVAEQAANVGAAAAVNPTRFEDKDVLPYLYPVLEQSETLADFYSKEITDSQGRKRTLQGVAERTRKVLENEENKYVKFVNRLHKNILDQMSYDDALKLSGKAFASVLVGAARSLQRHYKEEGIVVPDNMIFNAICFHTGYVLARTKLYMKKAGTGKPINVDRNDMEDAAILLHVNLSKQQVLVTNDGEGRNEGTIHALNEVLEQLRQASSDIGDNIVVMPSIMSATEFKLIHEVPAP